MRALVWPGREEELTQLESAADIARESEMTLVKGDAVEILEGVVAGIPMTSAPCLFQTVAVYQWPEGRRNRLGRLIESIAGRRDVYYVSMDLVAGDSAMLEMTAFENGARRDWTLALCEPHVERIEWLADPFGR